MDDALLATGRLAIFKRNGGMVLVPITKVAVVTVAKLAWVTVVATETVAITSWVDRIAADAMAKMPVIARVAVEAMAEMPMMPAQPMAEMQAVVTMSKMETAIRIGGCGRRYE